VVTVKDGNIVIPNAFSPNGDGINDTWQIKLLNSFLNAKVQVFNRQGQLVFNTKGYSKPWDGTSNGKPLPIGTYYYVIEPEMV
jgi:gliding motility-associated-like protein